jgi:AraC-like DNA-binding protein
MNGPTHLSFKELAVPDAPFVCPQEPERNLVELGIDPDLGFIKMDEVQHKHFSLGDARMEFNHNVTLTAPKCRTIHYGLAILGDAYKGTVKFDNGDWIDVCPGESYFTFNPGVDEIHRFAANSPMKVHYLQVEASYLTNLLLELQPTKGSVLYDFRESVMKNEFVGAGSRIESPMLRHIIATMFNCPLGGTIGNLMLEGSLQQLMALQFSSMADNEQKHSGISHRDRDIMFAVRDHLHATFNEDHSLAELAKRFGVNQNKLKTQFRELFGVPVIGYLFDLKMEHARMLLHDKGMFVSEVARVVGYSNPNHFATAFKRKYGTIPSKLKG